MVAGRHKKTGCFFIAARFYFGELLI